MAIDALAGRLFDLLADLTCIPAQDFLVEQFLKRFNDLGAPLLLQRPAGDAESLTVTVNGIPQPIELVWQQVPAADQAELRILLKKCFLLLRRLCLNHGHQPPQPLPTESETRLRTILEACPDPIVVYDLIGYPQYLNPAFTRIFGWDLETIGEKRIPFVPEDQAAVTENLIRQLFIDRRALSFESVRLNRVGQRLNVIVSAAVIPDQKGDASGAVVILTDITEKKKLEGQLQQAYKMEAIGMLAGGVAHDFNNILGIIIGNIDLALDGVPEWNPARVNLQEVRLAAERAKAVVHQLLGFSRKAEPCKKSVQLHALIQESLKLMRATLPATIEIITDLPQNTSHIMADPTQIHQVLLNLCTNAAHAMEERGGMLSVNLADIEVDEEISSRYPDLRPGPYVRLSVSDNGIGIPPEVKAHIFNPYFTTKRVGKGTGMGLAVVQSIVKNHNGAISVYSEPGQGTTVRVLFPAHEGRACQRRAGRLALPTGFEKILFIDDEPAMVEIGKNLLSRLGYTVMARTDPLEALALLRENPSQVDLVITDMTMPQMTGVQLAHEVRASYPELPIILCTGFSEKINGRSARQLSVDVYLEKPVDKRELAAAVRKALDRR